MRNEVVTRELVISRGTRVNIWLQTFLIALAGALGGALWAVLAVVVCVKIWSCVDPGFFTGLVAFTVWPLAGVIGAAKTTNWAGRYLDSFD